MFGLPIGARLNAARRQSFQDAAARAIELGDRPVDVAPLPLQTIDLFEKAGVGDLQLGLLPVAEIVKIEHRTDLLEGEADALAHDRELEPYPITPAVDALLPFPLRRQQSALLVEAQRSRRHAELAREVADGESLPLVDQRGAVEGETQQIGRASC